MFSGLEINFYTILLLSSLITNTALTALFAYFCLRIAMIPETPRWTWSLFFVANIIQLVQTAYGVVYIWKVATFISEFPRTDLIVSYGLGTTKAALFCVGAFAIYILLKRITGREKPQEIKQ